MKNYILFCLLFVLAHSNCFSMSTGSTPLHEAIKKSQEDRIADLIAQGVPIDAQDKKGRTALHYAAKLGDEGIAKLLMRHGADVNITDLRDRAPLHYAARSGDENTVSSLINSGANIRVDADDSGSTLLHCAVKSNNVHMVRLLINSGISLDDLEEEDECFDATPLHWAAALGNTNIVRFLVGKGANVNATDYKYRIPAQVAEKHGHTEIAQFLLDRVDDEVLEELDEMGLLE